MRYPNVAHPYIPRRFFMTLGEFIKEKNLHEDFDISSIPLIHPKTRKKIYVVSRWFSGFWYRSKPDKGTGRRYPCQYYGSILALEVHSSAEKEMSSL